MESPPKMQNGAKKDENPSSLGEEEKEKKIVSDLLTGGPVNREGGQSSLEVSLELVLRRKR